MSKLPTNQRVIPHNEALPFEVELDFLALHALQSLATSVRALRLAMDGAHQIPGELGRLPSGNGDPAEAYELAARCRAAMLLLSTAIGVVESDTARVVKVGNDLILDWCAKP